MHSLLHYKVLALSKSYFSLILFNSKSIKEKQVLPKAFAFIKISESSGSMVMTFLAGYVREKSGGFGSVCALLGFMALISSFISY